MCYRCFAPSGGTLPSGSRDCKPASSPLQERPTQEGDGGGEVSQRNANQCVAEWRPAHNLDQLSSMLPPTAGRLHYRHHV